MKIEEAFADIRHAIECGRTANGYLLAGPVHVAGRKLAEKVLQLLFCKVDADKPCGHCNECRSVREQTTADIHWVAPANVSRTISVDQIRNDIIAPISQSALAGGWKAGVIFFADRMNEAAANAFLKTLEEPPEKTLFLLLSDAPQFLLPTIISRCQRIDITAERDLVSHHKERLLGTLSGTLFHDSLEKAISANVIYSILSDIKREVEESVAAEMEKENEKFIRDKKERDQIAKGRISARYREIREDLLLVLFRWYRDLLLLRSGGSSSLLFFPDYAETLQSRAATLTLAQAMYNITALEDLTTQLERNLPDQPALAYAIDRMYHGVSQS